MSAAEQAVVELVKAGATLTPSVGSGAYPVGLMRPLADGRWFWWEAGGVDEFAGHVIEPDRVEVFYDGLGVGFYRGETMVGYLTTVKESIDRDEDIESVNRNIRDWSVEYAANESLRGFIERQVAVSDTCLD